MPHPFGKKIEVYTAQPGSAGPRGDHKLEEVTQGWVLKTTSDFVASVLSQLRSLKLENPPYNFDAAFQTLAQGGAQMVLVLSSALFVVGYGPPIGEIAIRHRLPTMFIFKGYVADGGLMSYGAEQTPMLRRAASYVAQILEGAKPADLPIEQTTEYVFAVNLKTAKAIGVTIPDAVLIRANEVIE